MADSEHLILPSLKFKVVVLIIIGLLCVSGTVLAESSASGGYGPYDHIFPQIDISRDQQICSVSINGTCPLYIALMMSFGDEFDSRGVIPGVQMAIQHINDDPSMLPGYSLHYVLKATQCETYGTSALNALHTHLLQPPTKIGIIGSGCSLATEATAQVSHYYNLTHISCVSASVELSNRERFRYYFQLLATEADLAFGFYGIIRHFRWRRVVILLQEERLFEVTMNRLVDLLKSEEQRIEVRVERFNSSSGVAGLGDHPFDPDYRIIVFAMFSKHARRLLCKASEQGIHYPRYEFIFYGWYAENWWRDEEETLQSLYNNNCSAAQRERVIGPALSPVQDEFISDCSKVADSGINGSIFQEEYQSFLKRSMNSPLNIKTQSMYAQHCYDATWTLAKALNSTIEDIQDVDVLMKLREFSQQDFQNDAPTDTEFTLQHFTYNNSAVLDLIYSHLNETLFNGITGKIFFESSDGLRRVPKIVVYQYRMSSDSECFTCLCPNMSLQNEKTLGRQPIATIENDNFTFRLLINEDELWTNGVPYDGIPREVVEKIHPAVTIIFCLLSTAGIVYAISCMLFNYLYRKKKLIKLSSPNLNYLIIVGAIILYVDVYLQVVPAGTSTSALAICHLTPWLTATGYSLCYGTMIVKMFRVFYIIHYLFSKKRFLKDWVLALAVAALVVIDTIIVIIYSIVEAKNGSFTAVLELNEEDYETQYGPTGIVQLNKFYICDSKSRDIALGILYGYKAVLQVIALVFSFSIGKIKTQGLNDAKYIIVAVYVTSVVTAVTFVSIYSLKTYLNLYATLFSFGIFVGTTVILVLVYLPKMIILYRDPECKSVVVEIKPVDNIGASSKATQKATAVILGTTDVETLQRKIKEMESCILSQQKQLELYTHCNGHHDE